MVMVWRTVLLLAGCNQAFGLDNTVTPDAPPKPPGCAGATFANPVEFANIPPQYGSPWFVTANELWLAHYESSATGYDIYITTRADETMDFPAPVLATGAVNSAMDGVDVAFANASLDLFLLRGTTVYEGTRAAITDTFTSLSPVGELVNFNASSGGIWVSPDGLSLYVSDGDLYVLHRASRTQPFGPMTLVAQGVRWPGLSPDELEVFYTADMINPLTLYRRVRATAGDVFPAEQPSDAVIAGDDASIFARTDGTEWLVYNDGGGISYMSRACR
jgi:hypothetical protein